MEIVGEEIKNDIKRENLSTSKSCCFLAYVTRKFVLITFVSSQAHGINYRRGFRPLAKYVHFSTLRRERKREFRCVLVRREYASAINVMILPANPSIISREPRGRTRWLDDLFRRFCATPLRPIPTFALAFY